MAGPLNMSNNKIAHLANPTTDKDAISRVFGDGWYVKKGGDTMTDKLALGDNYITGLKSKLTDYATNKPDLQQEIIDWKNAKWEDKTDNIFYKAYEQWTTYNGHATSFYFMKQLQLFWLLSNDKDYATINAFQVLTNKSRQSPPSDSQTSNKYFNLFGMIATNMKDPNDATDGVNKQYLEKSHVKPSHYNNEFKYPMTNRLAWTDLQADSFNITKIDNLMPQDGNYHQYNHKVLYTTIIKDQQGGYSYKMGINCYQLDKDKDYTLCIEILNSDYQLWHKSVATIDKTTSKGVSVAGFTVQKFSHRYTNSSGNTAYMYYIKIIVNFQKTVSGTFYSLDLYVNIPQSGIDLNTYPKNWTNNWMIAYGVFGKVSSIDPQKTYYYHTAFDIKPTIVVCNVNLDMNRKKILNIVPDKTKNNSAATVKMVKDLETKLSPRTKNNAYRKIFEKFYDLSDASNYKIIQGINGIMISGILPHIYFPRMDTTNVLEGGLRLQNTTLSLELFSKRSFTLCVVMQLWLNKSLSIKTIMSNGAYEKPHLIYKKTTKKLTLQTNGLRTGSTNETSITLLDSFNDKRGVFWLTKKDTGGDLKVNASISNYSGTLTLSSALASQSNYTFRISSEDAMIYKIMYTPNFHNLDSIEFHRIMLQEKLNGCYVV